MRQESNRKRSSKEFNEIRISNSRAMGIIILIALLFLFQIVTFVLQKLKSKGKEGDIAKIERINPPKRFKFNPNTITPDSLVLLGFTPRQAQTVINYREKGGVFRKKRDFAKLYVVDSTLYHSLEEFIVIPPLPKVEKKRDTPVQKRRTATSNVDKERRSHSEDSAAKVIVRESVYGKKVVKEIYKCNLNSADSADLVRLYGIGPYYAKKILRYRERLGGSFADPLQLLEIEGLSTERFSKIEHNLFVDKKDIVKFSLLDASREFLERHPYIGPYTARGILVYIGMKGEQIVRDNLKLLEELIKEGIISEENGNRLREYLINL